MKPNLLLNIIPACAIAIIVSLGLSCLLSYTTVYHEKHIPVRVQSILGLSTNVSYDLDVKWITK